MKRIFFGFIIFISFTFPVASEVIISKAGSDYKISIPNDWLEMPKEVLMQVQKAASEATGQNQTYEYGYQSSKAKNWLEYPYVLVQVKRNGRVPEGQLKKYEKIEAGFKEGIKIIEESAPDLLSNMSQGKTIYDPSIHTLWSNITMDVKDVGKVRGLIAVKLTEYGFIQFMGYSLQQDFTKYTPLYKKMVHSINLEKKDVYKPRITDNAPTIWGINLGQTAIAAIVGGLIGGLIALVSFLKKKLIKKDA